jgi:1-acyl-sn-glycerol-3-phosphate acyltransferase
MRLILRLLAQVEMSGVENLPVSGGFVIASNHVGRLDAALPFYFLEHSDIIVVVAEKYRKYAFFRWLARMVNGLFIDRYNADVAALRATLRRLQRGGILAMTPEGTRSKTGNLLEAKPGTVYLAWKAGVPILPVALTGSEDAVVVDRLKHFRRLKIKVVAGRLFTLPQDIKAGERDAVLQQATEEIMCRIAALLPEERRGFYADHPRLKELLKAS